MFPEIWFVGSSVGVEDTVPLKEPPDEMLTTNRFMIAFFSHYPISLSYEWSFIQLGRFPAIRLDPVSAASETGDVLSIASGGNRSFPPLPDGWR